MLDIMGMQKWLEHSPCLQEPGQVQEADAPDNH